MSKAIYFKQVSGFYSIIPLPVLRRTPGVLFDNVPLAALPRIDAIDRVLHASGAVSPGPVGEVVRPWYMHPHQDDNLVVLYGAREVDIYLPGQGMASFTVTPERIIQDGKVLLDEPAMLVWPRYVFHRIVSGPEGSASLNFASHYPRLNPKSNFNIYDLDPATGDHRVIREGFRDQPVIPEDSA